MAVSPFGPSHRSNDATVDIIAGYLQTEISTGPFSVTCSDQTRQIFDPIGPDPTRRSQENILTRSTNLR